MCTGVGFRSCSSLAAELGLSRLSILFAGPLLTGLKRFSNLLAVHGEEFIKFSILKLLGEEKGM